VLVYGGALEAGSYLRLTDSCTTQFKAQGPSRTCNESKEEAEVAGHAHLRADERGTIRQMRLAPLHHARFQHHRSASRVGFDSRGQATLETTLGQMAPPRSGRVQEGHLIQVAS